MKNNTYKHSKLCHKLAKKDKHLMILPPGTYIGVMGLSVTKLCKPFFRNQLDMLRAIQKERRLLIEQARLDNIQRAKDDAILSDLASVGEDREGCNFTKWLYSSPTFIGKSYWMSEFNGLYYEYIKSTRHITNNVT